MKLIHLSDLHIGKKVNERSMLEDQKYILIKILKIIDEQKPDGIIIAGDIYDKPVPPAEAVQVFDKFLWELSQRHLQVYIISGNHDSAERLAFGSRLIELSGIHISSVFNGKMQKYTLEDEFGKLNIYMLPFIKPFTVKVLYKNEEIKTYTDAVRCAVENSDIDESERNIIITHQFVTGAEKCDSEEISVGGTDNVDVEVFSKFDYVALGHLHGPQHVSRETVRYSGTPLKYSFSEAKHKKSVTILEFSEKGNIKITQEELIPKRDMRELKGTFEDITTMGKADPNKEDYIHITLLDEEDIPEGFAKLSLIYPNIMKLDYDNKRTRSNQIIGAANDIEHKSPLQLFAEFFEKQNNQPMSEEQEEIIKNILEDLRGEDK